MEATTVLWIRGEPTGGETGDEGGGTTGAWQAPLADAGFDVDSVAVPEAVDRLERESVDCVVCGGSATAVPVSDLRRVRETDPVVPIVFLAVDGDERLAHRAVAAGASEYLPVRDDPDEFAATDDSVARDGFVSTVERAVEAGERARERERARTQLRALFEETPDPVVEYEFADGEPVIRDLNRAFAETFGYDRATVVGEPLNSLLVPEWKADEAQRLDRRVRAGDRVTAELERETADGLREFLFRNIAVETGPDGPDGYGVYVDITEQKERERRLEDQNERLEEFASVVSHDLRNPMGAVKQRIEMARQTGELSHLADALGALDRMDELLRDLHRMAKQGEEVGRTEPVSLGDVAAAAWSHVATEGATLTVVDDPELEADRGRLTQLLENLFINAIEHSVGGDAAEDPDTTVRVGTGDGGCLYVADDGRGIPPGQRDTVFKSGYSTREEGSGYGLTIVRQVARAHGWEVCVTDSSDGGARFEFRGIEFHER